MKSIAQPHTSTDFSFSNMRFEIYILISIIAIVLAGKAGTSKVTEPSLDRFLWNLTSIQTFTLVKKTTTTTSTFTTTTTCTTSTSTLSACTAGRRRRGLFYDEGESLGKERRGLFYNDEDNENKSGSIFLARNGSDDPIDEVKLNKVPSLSINEDETVPLEVQSGYSLPDGVPANRFLLALATSTYSSIIIATSTSTLTATCSSTTAYPTCSSSG